MTVRVCNFIEDDAVNYGVTEALFINRLRFWVGVNRKAGRNQRDGRTWSYSSAKEIGEAIFASPATVRRVVRRLVDAGVLMTERVVIGGAEQPLNYAFVDENRFVGPHEAPAGGAVLGFDQRRRRTRAAPPADRVSPPQAGLPTPLTDLTIPPYQIGGGSSQTGGGYSQNEQALRYSISYSNSYPDQLAASAAQAAAHAEPSAQADGSRSSAPQDPWPRELRHCVGESLPPTPSPDAVKKLSREELAEAVMLLPNSRAEISASAASEAAARRHAAAAAISGSAGGGERAASKTASKAASRSERPAPAAKKPNRYQLLPPTELFKFYLAEMASAGYDVPQIMRQCDSNALAILEAACAKDEAKLRQFLSGAINAWSKIRTAHNIYAEVPHLFMLSGSWLEAIWKDLFPSTPIAKAASRPEDSLDRAMREQKARNAAKQAAANARSQKT